MDPSINIITNTHDSIVLCIPTMDSNISKEYIYSIFEKINVHIEKILEYNNKSNPNIKRVILHIKNPVTSSEYKDVEKFVFIRNRILENKDVKIVYKYPHYWKMVKAFR